MFRTIAEEAAALTSLALFLGMIAIWVQVIANVVSGKLAIAEPPGETRMGHALRVLAAPGSRLGIRRTSGCAGVGANGQARSWPRTIDAADLLQPREAHARQSTRSRIRAPARALVLFAARGRAADRAARRAGQGRPAAGAGAHRHRQHVRCARILRQARRPASSRLSAARWPSISPIRRAARRARRAAARRRGSSCWRRARRATAA